MRSWFHRLWPINSNQTKASSAPNYANKERQSGQVTNRVAKLPTGQVTMWPSAKETPPRAPSLYIFMFIISLSFRFRFSLVVSIKLNT